MNRRQVRQYEMLVRVRQFGAEQRDRFPEGSEGATAFATVAAAVSRFEAAAVSKESRRKDGRRVKAAAREALFGRLASIARNARVLGKGTPGAESRFSLPVRRSDVALLTAARAFLQELPAVKEALINCGLPATIVDDLRKEADAFEEAMHGRHALRTTMEAAKAGIREALRRGADAARSLDVLVGNVFGGDAETSAAWKSLRHVSGTARSASAPSPASAPDAPTSSAVESVAPLPTAEEPLRRAS